MFARFTSRRQSRKAARTLALSTACVFEAMETRRLMSSTLGTDGTLTITGTAGNDVISLVRNQTTLTLTDNNQVRTFPASQVTRIGVTLGAGNDQFSASWNVTQPVTVSGGLGNDTLSGGGAPDVLAGDENDDIIFASSPGGDWIRGGLGTDTVSYADATGAVNVTLDNVANDGLRGTSFFNSREFDNVMTDVENIYSGRFDDYLSAGAAPGVGHKIQGMVGNDYIVGSSNNDALLGYYGNDTIFGDSGNDSIWGEAGADLLGGGLGFDDLRYDDTMNQRTTGVVVVLPRSWETSYRGGQGSPGENDRILGFEAVWGSKFGDTIWGNDQDNWIFGLQGNDWISGEDGNDRLFGFDGNDTLFGGNQNDSLWGEWGDDRLSGGDGWDDVRYDEAGRTSRVQARLCEPWEASTTTNGSYDLRPLESDAILGDIEALIGTRFGDNLKGNSLNNYIAGLDGDDFIEGKGGDDTIDLGNGSDMALGGPGNDFIRAKDGIAGNDYIYGDEGWDTVERDRRVLWYLINPTVRSDSVVNCEVIR
jgi:Ca2+-binding RTX toxin-like protein